MFEHLAFLILLWLAEWVSTLLLLYLFFQLDPFVFKWLVSLVWQASFVFIFRSTLNLLTCQLSYHSSRDIFWALFNSLVCWFTCFHLHCGTVHSFTCMHTQLVISMLYDELLNKLTSTCVSSTQVNQNGCKIQLCV